MHSGTPLDEEAAQRGTSVYLVERRIDMLPKTLTEGYFSLIIVMVVLYYKYVRAICPINLCFLLKKDQQLWLLA